jgi:hypothetical protein
MLIYASWKNFGRNRARSAERNPIARDVEQQVARLKRGIGQLSSLIISNECQTVAAEVSVKHVLTAH